MPSVFFYRARGVPGAYVVGIQLDLLPTESARVSVASVRVPNNSGVCNPLSTKNGHAEEEQRQLYRIEQLVIDDTITIHIEDRQLIPFQTTIFTATSDGFTKTDVPYQLRFYDSSRVRSYETRAEGWIAHDFGVITLNAITMIDCDKEAFTIEQPPRIVEAAPIVALPKPKRRPKVSRDNEPKPT